MQITLVMFLVLANLTWLWFNLIWFWELRHQSQKIRNLRQQQQDLQAEYRRAWRAYHHQAEQLLQQLHQHASIQLDDYQLHLRKMFQQLQQELEQHLQKSAKLGESQLWQLWQTHWQKLISKQQTIQAEYLSRLNKLYSNTEKVLHKSMENYLSAVRQQTVEQQHQVIEQLNLDLANMQQEIRQYQQQRQSQIDELVSRRVEQLSRQLLGESLSRQQHQRIIRRLVDYLDKNTSHD